MYVYDRWLFKIPVYFTVDYISRHLLAETDFEKEAINGARTRAFIDKEPSLRDKVFIPRVRADILSPRVMVAEVIVQKAVATWY
jgi:aarF domain-containing kinase